MKKITLLSILLMPLLSIGQWNKIGADIDGEAAGDQSGAAISLSSDGNVVAIGAYDNDGSNVSSSSHVSIYQNISGVWTQIGTDIDGEASYDNSGHSVSLSSDGSVVAFGAPYNDENGNASGHVRIFSNPSLSIQKNTFGAQFSVSPNPSFGSSKIQLGANYKEVTVQVYTILGKLVSTQKHSNTNEISLDTQKFTNGIYIVKVESGTKKASLKLVVK